MYSWTQHSRPELLEPYLHSRQLNGTVGKAVLRTVTTPISAIALLLIPIFAYLAWRRRDAMACSLVAGVSAALVTNAFLTGALSDVHDRYQSRVVWLAPLTLAVLFMRWHSSVSEAESALSGISTIGFLGVSRHAPRFRFADWERGTYRGTTQHATAPSVPAALCSK